MIGKFRDIPWQWVVATAWFTLLVVWGLNPTLDYKLYEPAPSSAASMVSPINSDERLADYTGALAKFTAVLAIVTTGLAAATFWLAWLAKMSSDLARNEFNATHRPKIIIHSLEAAADSAGTESDSRISARLTFANVGDTKATDLIVSGKILTIRDRPTAGIQFGQIRRLSVCPTGIPASVFVISNINNSDHVLRLSPSKGKSDHQGPKYNAPYCIGTISYTDELGVRRTTGFCWKLSGFRWIRQSKSEYEYAY